VSAFHEDRAEGIEMTTYEEEKDWGLVYSLAVNIDVAQRAAIHSGEPLSSRLDVTGLDSRHLIEPFAILKQWWLMVPLSETEEKTGSED
jgi:hypothetical protein